MMTYFPDIQNAFQSDVSKEKKTFTHPHTAFTDDDDDDEFYDDIRPTKTNALSARVGPAFDMGRIDAHESPCEIMCFMFAHVLKDRAEWFQTNATPWTLLHLFLNMHHYLMYGPKEPDPGEFRYYQPVFIPMLHWTFHHALSHDELRTIVNYVCKYPNHPVLYTIGDERSYLQKITRNVGLQCECCMKMDVS
jgi:hypothetical protein